MSPRLSIDSGWFFLLDGLDIGPALFGFDGTELDFLRQQFCNQGETIC